MDTLEEISLYYPYQDFKIWIMWWKYQRCRGHFYNCKWQSTWQENDGGKKVKEQNALKPEFFTTINEQRKHIHSDLGLGLYLGFRIRIYI